MKQIYQNLFIGNDSDCGAAEFAIIHACKTCHARTMDYKKSLPAAHENYLIYESGDDIYLNLVDMNTEFSPKFTHPIFAAAIKFISDKIADKKILIHCNQGLSRSASLGLIYLAIMKKIPDDSFESAECEFIKLYPNYAPGNGIKLYMQHNWDYLMRLNSN